MRTIELTLYTYDELPTDAARERAREWHTRHGLEHGWWEYTYDDAKEIGEILGFTIDEIYFSGFCQQGDGASFRGHYQYAAGWREKLAGHCPKESAVFAIGEALQAIQRRRLYSLTATIGAGGSRYSHEGTMSAAAETADGRDVSADDEAAILECARDFARWIYAQLEREHDYQNGEECVSESIRANEYEFLADGRRA